MRDLDDSSAFDMMGSSAHAIAQDKFLAHKEMTRNLPNSSVLDSLSVYDSLMKTFDHSLAQSALRTHQDLIGDIQSSPLVDALTAHEEMTRNLPSSSVLDSLSVYDSLMKTFDHSLAQSALRAHKDIIDDALASPLLDALSVQEEMMEGLRTSPAQVLIRDHDEMVRDYLDSSYASPDELFSEDVTDQFEEANNLLTKGDSAKATSVFLKVADAVLEALKRIPSNVQTRAVLRHFRIYQLQYTLFLAAQATALFLHQYAQETSDARFNSVDEKFEEIRVERQEAFDATRTQQAEIMDTLSKLGSAFGQAAEQTALYQYYLVKRMTPLTADRHHSGRRLMTLMPGYEVELLERAGKWIRVEAYDPVTQRVMKGWVLKKYLKRVG